LVDTETEETEYQPASHPAQVGAHDQALESRSGPAVDLGLLDELTSALSEVQDALERLDNGTYAHCEHCGDPIDDTMLEASPTVRLCAAHLPFGQAGNPADKEPEHQG
jgi:RNA polymerase-binding transcription factor DksA